MTVRSTDGCSGGSFVNPRLLYFVHLFGHSYSGRVQRVFSILLFDFNCHRRISGVHLSIDIAFGDVVNPGMIDCCIRDPNRILSSLVSLLEKGSALIVLGGVLYGYAGEDSARRRFELMAPVAASLAL